MKKYELISDPRKKILDVTCGSRTIWFNKNHPAAIYAEKRKEGSIFEVAFKARAF